MADETVTPDEIDVPPNFSVIAWAGTIPLCDDLWLRMQAQHIAAVDIGIIRPLELQTARRIFNEEGVADVMLALNGVSQMWLFSLFEFLRTWRQRAKQILTLADQYTRTKPSKQAQFLADAISNARGKEKHVYSAPVYYAEQISRIGSPDFVASVQDYFDKTDGWFGAIDELRVTLAKHEVKGSKKMVAEMPGYCRIDQISGTLYWQYVGPHGGLEKLDRRDAANFFLDIAVRDYRDEDWHE